MQQHLRGGVKDEDNKNKAQKLARHRARQGGAAERAEKYAGCDIFDDLPVHRAMLVVRAQAGSRGENDGGHRGAERQMDDAIGGKFLDGECGDQHGHDDESAADAE